MVRLPDEVFARARRGLPELSRATCRSCDRLYDVPVEGVGGLRIAGEEGFVVLLRRLCPACSAAGEGPAAGGPGV